MRLKSWRRLMADLREGNPVPPVQRIHLPVSPPSLMTSSSRSRLSALVLGLTLAGLSAGCRSTTLTTSLRPEAVLVPPGSSLVVVPFENLSGNRHAGLALTDLAGSVLYSQEYFRVIDISALQDDKEVKFRRLESAPWERQVGANTAAAAAIGRSLKADCVLAGSVGEYGFVDGFGETATVGITLRLVRSSNGEVLWAGSMSRRVNSGAFNEESAHRLAHNVLRDLLGRMIRDLGWQQKAKTQSEK